MKLRQAAIVFLALALILTGFHFLPSSAKAEQEWYSGRTTLEWTFDEETGTLTITNTGTNQGSIMGFNYYDNPSNPGSAWSKAPWYKEDNGTPYGDCHLKIRKVVIGQNITAASGCAFCDCPNLTTADIRYTSMIGHEAFRDCPSLTTVILPENLTGVHYGAFQNCTGLQSLTITGDLTEIGERAFEGCTGLTTLTLPDSVTKIGDRAFVGCKKLKNFTLPASLRYIGNEAFMGRTDLTSMVFPGNLQDIGDYAFKDCTNLASVTFPASLQEIGEQAFAGCRLSSVNAAQGTETADWVFYYPNPKYTGNYLYHASIPKSVTSVGYAAFFGNPLPYDVPAWNFTLPSKVTAITAESFSGTDARYVRLPEGVTSVGSSAFAACTSLKGVYLPSGCTSFGENAFPEGTVILMDAYLSYNQVPAEIRDYVNDNNLKLLLLEDPNGGNG